MSSQKLEPLIAFARRMVRHPLVRTLLIFAGMFTLAVIIVFAFLHVFTRHGEGHPVPDVIGLSQSDALQQLERQRLRMEIADSVYIAGRTPGTVVDQNPAPGVFVKPQRRVFVVVNAMNPKLVEVPNVIGVSIRQAKSRLQTAGFSIGSLSFAPDLAVNVVLEQRYQDRKLAPAAMIPKGSRIDLVLGRGLANEQTVMPNLIGLNLAQAHNLLIEASLNLGRVTFDQSVRDQSDSVMAMVFSYFPAHSAFVPLPFGTRVDLRLTLNQQLLPRPEPAVDTAQWQPIDEPLEEILE